MSDVVWKLVVDDEGSIKKMELFSKSAEKTDKGMEKTKKSAKDTEHGLKSLGGAFGSLKSMMGMALGGIGFAGVGFGLESVLSKTSEVAQETEKFHSATGMSAQSSLYYVAALKARGVGTEAVVKGYKTLGKAIQSAERQQYTYAVGQEKAGAKGKLFTTQLGVQAEAFHQLGINFSTFKALKPEQQFQAITEKFEKLPAGIEKTRLATQIFGRGGTALLPVLEKGSTSLKTYRNEAERFFPTLKGGKNVMNEVIAAQSESKMAWEGLEFTLGTAVAPALVKVERAFSSLIAEGEHGKGPLGELVHTFEGIGNWAGKAGGFIKGIASDLGFKLPAGTLGAVLAMAGLHAAKHPIGDAKKAGSLLTKGLKFAGKYGSEVEGAAAGAASGGAATGGAGAVATGGAMVAAPVVGYGGLVLLDKGVARGLKEMMLGSGEGGGTHYGAKEREELAQAKRENIRALEGGPPSRETRRTEEYLQASRNTKADIHINGLKVGEVIARDAGAMRHIAEGVERAMNGRKAR